MGCRGYKPIWAALAFVVGVPFLLTLGISPGRGQNATPVRALDISLTDAHSIEKLGWDPVRLKKVFAHAATLSTDSLMIVTDGRVVGSYGDLSRPYNVHSIRKSLLSALVGQYVGPGPGQIRLEATLRHLSIDDDPVPLTKLQRQATVEHLLKSKSGINHRAAAEAGLTAEKDRRLGTGANVPGTIWAYNNWDYNALTTIFEKQSGLSVAEAFRTGIADPAGMRDFRPEAVSYISEPMRSQHKSAAFRLSARDLALFGEIYLNKGRINNRQVLPASWVERITANPARTGRGDLRWGHSDLWWLAGPAAGLPDGTFWAWGLGNQALFVVPAWQSVIVVQSDTTEFLKRFARLKERDSRPPEVGLEELILSCLKPSERNSEYCVEHRFTTRREFAGLITLIVEARKVR